MEKQILVDETPENREQTLKNSCDRVEKYSYMKEFSEKELQEFKESLSKLMIDLNKLEEELKEVKKEYQDKMKPLKESTQVLIENLKHKSRLVEEECYVMLEHEEGKAGYYNAEGELVHERPLNAEEMQKTIMSINRETQ